MSTVTTEVSIPEVLGAPLPLRSGLVLSNRFAKAAMSETLAGPGGEPSSSLETLYRRLGAGGTGLLITGNVMVRPDGVGEPGNVIARSGVREEGFARWAQAAKAGGARAFMQINHAGRQSPRLLNAAPVAPSAVPVKGAGGMFMTPRALEEAEIEAIVEAFGRTAALAKRAGFDGVQIHGAHGYLVSQFLSPLTNLRGDRWGGSLEARMRFVLEVYRAVRRATGAFTVALKLNSADFLRGGFTNEEAIVVARTLDEEGLDLLEISGGTYEKPKMVQAPAESSTEREAHFLEYARAIRAHVHGALMLTGGLRTPAVMAGIVADGSVDVIGLARPIALEPDLPAQILGGRTQASAYLARQGRFQLATAAVDTSWAQRQMHRMGAGREPDAKVSAIAAVAGAACGFVRARVSRGRARATAGS